MNQETNIFQRFDYSLFAATMLLIVFGILMIASATQGAVDPDLISRVPDQINFAIISVVAVFLLTVIDYRMLGGLHIWLYVIMIILLLMVEFLGVEGDAGAQRWINLGIRIQPSEIGKIIIIVTLSNFYANNYTKMESFGTVIKSLIHLAVPTALIFLQPDLGTTIVFGVIWFAISWGAGIRLRHVALLGTVVAIVVPLGFSKLEDYQVARFTTFICIAIDGCQNDEAVQEARYNIDQAIISIGSGGLFGKGYTVGSQNAGRFLRVRHTDFIFSVIAHEFGFAGAVATMCLLGFVVFRILKGARYASDPLGSLICYGVAGMIFFQTVVSIGMNLSLMPVTGLTLPFVSSGGTSLLFTMIGIGLVQSVIVRRKRLQI
ncbi:rod shape-determining protein RodA [Phototrophicus methaneseepsis]|uniref:Rod shape-determining protein RodA n=1 Tax=Phototrophicus methaneseepsis TaxID=2710758 RepID=A0A7S8IDR7_9CHLR|nr:FtsW/RodA/SpoVE family cell cycle protein [Phototrophicus methaneseepsis]QPC81629.1 rod shape-determining protein RodA [Phototrophicus methaneseepsis]